MNWALLVNALFQIGEEIFASIEQAKAAGKDPAAIHQTIVDHVAQLPAKIRE